MRNIHYSTVSRGNDRIFPRGDNRISSGATEEIAKVTGKNKRNNRRIKHAKIPQQRRDY